MKLTFGVEAISLRREAGLTTNESTPIGDILKTSPKNNAATKGQYHQQPSMPGATPANDRESRLGRLKLTVKKKEKKCFQAIDQSQ